MTNLY